MNTPSDFSAPYNRDNRGPDVPGAGSPDSGQHRQVPPHMMGAGQQWPQASPPPSGHPWPGPAPMNRPPAPGGHYPDGASRVPVPQHYWDQSAQSRHQAPQQQQPWPPAQHGQFGHESAPGYPPQPAVPTGPPPAAPPAPQQDNAAPEQATAAQPPATPSESAGRGEHGPSEQSTPADPHSGGRLPDLGGEENVVDEQPQPQHTPVEQPQNTVDEPPAADRDEYGTGDFFATAPAAESFPYTGDPSRTVGHTAGPSALFEGAFGGGEAFVPGGGVAADDEQIAAKQRQRATGWRRAVAASTFGLITPAPGARQLHDEEIRERIRTELADIAVVGFVNAKGGAGKTTMAVTAGNTIASHRGDRVIVADVDPDLGNLSARFRERGGQHTNIESLAALKDWRNYSVVRGFTVQNEDRLEMLSSQNDPRSTYRLSVEDFESTMRILRTHYNVIMLDCGTAITSPLFSAIAAQATCLVVVASADAPGLNGAWRTLSWLQSHGLGRLLSRTVLTINATSGDKPAVDMADAESRFREQIQEVVRIPFDEHLHEGGFINLASMSKKTRKAAVELAGSIARYYPVRYPDQQGMGGY